MPEPTYPRLFLTPLARQEALPIVERVGPEPIAIDMAREATGDPTLGEKGLHIVVASRDELPAFGGGKQQEFVLADQLHTPKRLFRRRSVRARGASVVDMQPMEWTNDSLIRAFLIGCQHAKRNRLFENKLINSVYGFIGAAAVGTSPILEHPAVSSGVAAIGLGLFGWALRGLRRNRAEEQDLNARHWRAKAMGEPFTLKTV